MKTSLTERTPSDGRQPYLSAGIACARSTSFLPASSIEAVKSVRNPEDAAGWSAPAEKAAATREKASTEALSESRSLMVLLLLRETSYRLSALHAEQVRSPAEKSGPRSLGGRREEEPKRQCGCVSPSCFSW